jgi:serine/threonine-protein kinase
MTPERWKRICAVLDRVFDAPPEARAGALADACRDEGIDVADAEPFVVDEARCSKFLSGLDPTVVSRALRSIGVASLTAGVRLGPYEIVEPLGAGGMGEVYRARDTTLRREVALKLLPPCFVQDPDRVSRFTREAQALAALSHPNIAAIHGLQEGGGAPALVLELVEGRTLEELVSGSGLSTSGLPITQALDIARQIADALAAAHSQGIVHRDLKPSNIKIRPDGLVKVLDFGLAKLVDDPADVHADDRDVSMSPTIAAPEVTQGRTILGTAAYMSPEQASGGRVDKRADIWAFGCLLYELLTGRRPFQAESVSGTLVLVLGSDPDWTALPASTPAPLRRLLRRCLVKDPRRRLADIADARFEIDESRESDTAGAEDAKAVATPRRRRWVWVTAIGINVLALIALWSWLRPPAPAAPVVMRFTSPAVFNRPGVPALSRDGRQLAYQRQAADPVSGLSRRAIYIRKIEELVARPVAGTDDAMEPAFSPDGNWIAFLTSSSQMRSAQLSNLRQLKKVPAAGGEAQTLAEGITPGHTELEWGDDQWIYFTSADSLLRVRSSGGAPETLATIDPARHEVTFNSPQLLTGGNAVLVSIPANPDLTGTRVVVIDLASRERRTILEDAGIAKYLPSGPGPNRGHLVYGRDGAMFAVAFDALKREPIGSPVRVIDGVRGLGPRSASFGFSTSGTLVFVPDAGTDVAPAWVDRHGNDTALPLSPGQYFAPTVAPDGARVALLMRRAADDERTDLWVHDFTRGTMTRLSFDGDNGGQIWSPDSRELIFVTETKARPHALVATAADGSGTPRLLLNPDERHVPMAITPDRRTLIMRRDTGTGAGRSSGYFTLALPSDASKPSVPEPLLESRFAMGHLSLSPDGKWAAYDSSESGRVEIYVVPFPAADRRWQISPSGGTWPVWNENGHELFYRNRQDVMSVRIDASPTFRSATPVALFSGRHRPAYDFDRERQRFLMLKLPDAPPSEHHVVVNWQEELKRLVPTR